MHHAFSSPCVRVLCQILDLNCTANALVGPRALLYLQSCTQTTETGTVSEEAASCSSESEGEDAWGERQWAASINVTLPVGLSCLPGPVLSHSPFPHLCFRAPGEFVFFFEPQTPKPKP